MLSSRGVCHGVLILLLAAMPLAGADPAVAGAGAADAKAGQVQTAIATRMLIISIDGARPDLLLRANMPTVHALLPQSAFTFWARTTPHSITLPSHVSMLTGVVPRKHKIEWNEDLKLVEPFYPKFPTLFELAHQAGRTTALIAGKAKFSALNKPGTIDWIVLPAEDKAEDTFVADKTVEIIGSHQPDVLFVHLPTVDNAGHKHGWSSAEQMKALEGADAAIARILKALDAAKVREKTAILITSDHGGAGLTHLADDPRARFIPWIISGPGIRKGVDLTINAKTKVDTEDTFATAAYLLGLAPAADIDGKPVIEVLEKPVELLRSE